MSNHNDLDTVSSIEEFNEHEQTPSKSQRKREAHALQALGEQLIALKSAVLATIPLPDELLSAVQAAQGMHKHGALRRQRQYIGKLMRNIDVLPIQQALDALQASDLASKRQHRDLERWVNGLLDPEQSKITLETIFDRYPQAERQHLRQLIRKAMTEHQHNKPPAARRLLFRYLREISAGDYNNNQDDN